MGVEEAGEVGYERHVGDGKCSWGHIGRGVEEEEEVVDVIGDGVMDGYGVIVVVVDGCDVVAVVVVVGEGVVDGHSNLSETFLKSVEELHDLNGGEEKEEQHEGYDVH